MNSTSPEPKKTSKKTKSLSTSKVFVRLRPEVYDGSGHDSSMPGVAKSLERYDAGSVTLKTEYMFSSGNAKYTFPRKVFFPRATQQSVYDEVAPPLVEKCLTEDVLLLAYGQSGTGKTYTIFGKEGSLSTGGMAEQEINAIHPDWGFLPRLTFDLFEKLEKEGGKFLICLSCIEFYIMSVIDLLNGGVITIDGDKGPVGYTYVVLENRSSVFKVIEVSSSGMLKRTSFTILDLAGAERPSKVAELGEKKEESVAGETLVKIWQGQTEGYTAQEEGWAINYTLFEFCKEVKLATNIHRARKPYRAPRQMCMPLTSFLGRCIDGRAFMSMIVCLSQAPQCGWETWFSMQYGTDLAALKAPIKKAKGVLFTRALKEQEKRSTDATKAFERCGSDNKYFYLRKILDVEEKAVLRLLRLLEQKA